MVCFPNAKINIGLYVTHKRDDGFHDLETVFYPVPLCDALEIVDAENDFSFSSSGIKIETQNAENLCVRAFRLMQQNFPEVKNIQMHLLKNIPTGAGLGGGSADAAFALKLINQKSQLKLSEKTLAKYALQLGSDCPFFIYNKPCAAKGRGEILKEIQLDLSNYYLVLIHPKIHVNTGWAFKQLQPKAINFSLEEIVQQPVEEWKNLLRNDFEKSVFEAHPSIKIIKEKLYQYGAAFASMSGSGSSVYGLFREKPQTADFGFDKEYFCCTAEL